MIRLLPFAGFALLVDQLTKDAAFCVGKAMLLENIVPLLLAGIIAVLIPLIIFRKRCGVVPKVIIGTGLVSAVLDLSMHQAVVLPWQLAGWGISIGVVLLLIGLVWLGYKLIGSQKGGNIMNTRVEAARPLNDAPRGMTLIEILVVITIIGIVITVVAVGVVGWLSDAKVESSRTLVDKVAASVMQYANMKHELPSDLKVLVERKYITNKQTRDPWNNDLFYQPGNSNELDDFRLCSNGEDGSASTDDDICYGAEDE